MSTGHSCVTSSGSQPSLRHEYHVLIRGVIMLQDVRYCESDWLLFGSETHGFPEATVTSIKEEGALVRIPMSERHVRSLNLAVSVGIGLFESLRQLEAHNTLVQNECQEMLHVTPGLAADERATSPMGT